MQIGDIAVKKTCGMIKESPRESNLDWGFWEHELGKTFRLRRELWVGAGQLQWGEERAPGGKTILCWGWWQQKREGSQCRMFEGWGQRESGVPLGCGQGQITRSLLSHRKESWLFLGGGVGYGSFWSVWAGRRHDQVCAFKKVMWFQE